MSERTWNLLGGAAAVALAGAIALVPTNAFANEGDVTIDGDTYTEVIFNRTLGVWANDTWAARCPATHRWLHKDVGTPGQSLGQGIRATSGKSLRGIVTTEDAWSRDGSKPEDGRGGWLISSTRGTVINFNDEQWLRMEMVCTSDPKMAWNTR